MLRTSTRAATLTAAYADVRAFTEELAAPLSPEDQTVQSMPDVSPTKWHRAHTTWFFETFLLKEYVPGYQSPDPAFDYLFNSYYEAVGDRHPRGERGLISRPSIAEVAAYRAHVDDAMTDFLATLVDENGPLLDLVELGLHHEQQHQELLLMDIKHVLSVNPMFPVYGDRADVVGIGEPAELTWTSFAGGEVEIGHDGEGFAFDCEGPRHRVLVPSHALADRPVTCGEWLAFMDDRGYDRPELWLSEGWHTVNANRWRAPSYWNQVDGQWHVFTLHGNRPVDPSEPVVHVSLYEADAFARWADARLPTEVEWEHAATDVEIDGNFADTGVFHPRARASNRGLSQLFGDVWEWTSSAYLPYPGFRAAEGAVGEYNGKFMINQNVLRGGCCATPAGHTRATYRNFFPAHSRWMFSGLRLAKDL